MKNNIIKKILSNEKGITLISLIITIGVMLLLATVTIGTGTKSLDTTILQGFYMQLEIVQKRVDDIAITNEIYTNNSGNIVDIKNNANFNLTASEENALKNILEEEEINLGTIYSGLTVSDFKYFSSEELDKILDLKEIKYNVFIHFPSRTVIAEQGIEVNGEKYYMLNNNIYFPKYDSTKNNGIITDLEFKITNYGADSYKITVEPKNMVADLNAYGTLRYKETTTKYWETASGLEMIISELGQYNIEYTDSNKNIVTEIIEVYLVNDIPNIMVYNYS